MVPEEEKERKGVVLLIFLLVVVLSSALLAYQFFKKATPERINKNMERVTSIKDMEVTKLAPLEITSDKDVAPIPTSEESTVAKYNQEGILLFSQGRYEEAAENFRKAYDHDPTIPVVRKNLAYSHGKLGEKRLKNSDYAGTISEFKKAREYYEGESEFSLGLGIAYYQLNREEEAIAELSRAIKENPEQIEAYRILAQIYYEREEMDSAVNYLEEFLKYRPQDQGAQQLLIKVEKERNADEGLRQESTLHFSLRFDGREDGDIYREVLGILEEAYRDIGSALSYYPEDEVVVFLYTNQQFRDISNTPDWSGAIYDGKIRVPVGNYKHDRQILSKILYHEYTHAVVHEITHGRVPTWLNEGLAQYFEKGGEEEKLKAPDLVPLSSLHGSFMGFNNSQATLAYTESYSAVRYLIRRYGTYDVKRLLEEMGKGEDIDQAFRDILYLSYEDFEREWQRSLE